MRQSGTAEEQRGAASEQRVWLRERKSDLVLWQHRRKISAQRSEERVGVLGGWVCCFKESVTCRVRLVACFPVPPRR